MYKMEYIFDVTTNEVENKTYREALELQYLRAKALADCLWNKKKVAGKIVLLSEKEEARIVAVNKGLRWLEQKLKELDGETVDMKG